jgi:ribosome-associated protein
VTARKDSIPPQVRAAVAAAHEKQAADVVLLDLEGLGAFTDHFIICTGFSARQVAAICDETEKRVEQTGARLLHREGKPGGDWMLLDFGSLIVHVFTEYARRFYDLERLWRSASRLEFAEGGDERTRPGAAEAEG